MKTPNDCRECEYSSQCRSHYGGSTCKHRREIHERAMDEMFKPWITIPAEDVRVQLPMGLHDGDVKIMFRDASAVEKTIEQLKNLKELLSGMK